MNSIFLICILIFLNIKVYAESIALNVCADDNEQFPFIIIEKGSIKGIEFDILNMVIHNLKGKLNINLKFEIMPWSRCIQMVQKGQMDAAMNASYNDERSLFLDYPPNSGPLEPKPCSSDYKLACSGYIVITLKTNKFEYDGKPLELPRPVRVSRGYSVVPELEKIFHNDDLEISKSDLINVKKLIRDKEGSLVAYIAFKSELNRNKEILKKVKIHNKSYVMKSYYIPFSKKSIFTNEQKILFWNEIKKITTNKKIMDKINSKY